MSSTMGLFQKVNDLIFKLMIPLVIFALLLGFAKIVFDLGDLFGDNSLDRSFAILVTNILSMFVVIELFKGIIEYFEIKRMRITSIIDAGLVFLLREIMIAVYQHKLSASEIGFLSLALIAVAITRTLAVVYNPNYYYMDKEPKIAEDVERKTNVTGQ